MLARVCKTESDSEVWVDKGSAETVGSGDGKDSITGVGTGAKRWDNAGSRGCEGRTEVLVAGS